MAKQTIQPPQAKKLTGAEEVALIRKKLKHNTGEWQPKYYLDTGVEELNQVLGTPGKGIPYGKMIEISGPESNGKSGLCIDMVALAQGDGAATGWLDAESSVIQKWFEARGADFYAVALIDPMIGTFSGKQKKKMGESAEQVKEKKLSLRMAVAEELLMQMEEVIKARYSVGVKKQLWVLDSVTALDPKESSDAGVDGQNMKTKLSLAVMLNSLLRRWVGLCQATNTTIILVNQIRVNPMKMFGNPEYTPGGKALKFYCHVRVQVRRGKGGGKMKKNGKQIGMKGVMKCVKSKVGGVEEAEVGYKFYYKGKTVFLNAEKVKQP